MLQLPFYQGRTGVIRKLPANTLLVTCCHSFAACKTFADPNLLDTLEAYDGSVDFLRSLELDGDALTKAIIGTMGDLDAYQLPDAKGYTAFSRCGRLGAMCGTW
jgi:Zn-dependent M16 (insulinase) family peptidase